jgi:hypothetical protein
MPCGNPGKGGEGASRNIMDNIGLTSNEAYETI